MAASASVTLPSKAISVELAERAVKALLKWKAAKSKDRKPQLLSSDEFLYLVVTLKKIPQVGRRNPHRIPLTHPLYSAAGDDSCGTEVCLFVDDRPGRRPTTKDAKAKITAEKIPISKVIKFSKLKSDYKPFEAKRNLCDSYELFLADRRIIPLLPKALGKHFYKKKKIPIAMDLGYQNWKEQVERICGCALLFLKTGTCSAVRVARGSMEKEKIVENVVAAINGVAETVPRKWKNIRSLHLKFSESLALPIYQSVPEMNLKISGMVKNEGFVEQKKRAREEEDELSSENWTNVAKKGRIHEVRYMDGGVSGLLGANESQSDEEDVDVFEKEMSDDDMVEDKTFNRGRESEEVVRKGKDLKQKKGSIKGKAGVAVGKAKIVKEKENELLKSTNMGKKVKTKKLKS